MHLPLGLIAALVAGSVSAQTAATYRVVFDATWSVATHPEMFPADAHFSPLVGATHDGSVTFWRPGALASPGMEQMAETGGTTLLNAEFAAAGGAVGQAFAGPALASPGQGETTVTVTDAHPLVTLVTMVAPSPDWFLGTHSLDLRDGSGGWRESASVELFAYDAGTDSGPTYTSPDQDTQPRDPIALLTVPPVGMNGMAAPMGTFTFTRLSVDGEAPPATSRLALTLANPAPAGARIAVSSSASPLSVIVVSVTGRRVAMLYDGPGGAQSLALPPLPAGVYVVIAETDTARVARVVTVVR